ncbi:MAG: PhzF family phenazine biosynthesis protein [Betaproteobacteria bacterium]|nr:MAG: PhzF family phenazine biosynthesis protein [Betaproteobacteria bacterium]
MSVAGLQFKQVDVFTRVPFRGNPVAVVLGADALDGGEMQRIAAWTNLSETTFVLPPSSAGADYRLRIFTPRAELPFAGHPTIGSLHAVLEARLVTPRNGRLRQECGAGILELSTDGERHWVKSPPASVASLEQRRRDEVERTLGAAISGTPRIVNVGPKWLVADLGDSVTVANLALDMASVAQLSALLEITGITVFGAADDDGAALHVRSFAPAHGIAEDPVCGSGNISVAAYLHAAGLLQRFGSSYEARQGMALGRDGRVSIRIEGGEIFLGGNAVTCVEGELRLS